MTTDHVIRDATLGDADACAAIYEPYVRDTTLSFEEMPPTGGEMAGRIARAMEKHAWLVLERDGEVVGYAYGGRLGVRPAYRWSCEVSVYMARDRQRQGGGRALYEALLERLEQRGYRQALAVISVPNEPSVGLHESLGFKPVGLYENVGYKKGQWLTTAWMQRQLGEGASPGRPPEPR
ncbi:GNAT family N-acetyltransferase [Kineosporia succinea]|uniref:Phosphinothricin acetyltransferase n=1 Tax=Kineosporia succinea TaxID=84632 RepID=A0ABT9P1L8_9ACTN|nr:GNAT family N-acetyltransferase [Kineosporia succinea]MDP9826566.1 phosphinothricin acetyltransferase [Kineosporia succinea]